jgi:hypothetical protein
VNPGPILNAVDNVAVESATAAGRPALSRIQSAGSRIGEGITGGASIPAVKAVPDNVATAAARPALSRIQSAGSRIGEGITGGASIPAVKAVPDNVATAAGRPRLDRVQSAPALIDSTRIPNPKIEEALAAKTRKELITVGLLAGGVGGISGGLIGNAAASDQF